MITCQFCKNTFTTQSNLATHQKNAKYCLKLQNIDSKEKFECILCKKSYNRKSSYDRHMVTQHDGNIDKYKSIIDNQSQTITNLESVSSKYLGIISELTNKLENIAVRGINKTTTTNIQNNINLLPLSIEHLDNSARLLTKEHIKGGYEGLAKFAVTNSFKDRIKSTDVSRGVQIYSDIDGKNHRDPTGRCISTKFFDSLRRRIDIKQLFDKTLDEFSSEIIARYGDENTFSYVDSLNIIYEEICDVRKGLLKFDTEYDTEIISKFWNEVNKCSQINL